MTITETLTSRIKPNEPFTMKDAYDICQDITTKKHSVRARIYNGVKQNIFKKISKGVYTLIDNNDNQVLLIQGDGRDLSMLEDESIDCIITDHPYLDKKSNKGGSRSFADYDTFLYTQKDFEEKARVLKDGAFIVEFFAEENANNYEYIYKCKQIAKNAGLNYYTTVNWKKGNFVSNTGRKSKNTEQLVFFTKGAARPLKLDAKKNIQELKQLGFETKGLSSYGVADILNQFNAPIHRMKGTSKMLPTVFDVEPPSRKDRIHQAEKPVELFEQLLDYITLENEVVLDQFTGSGNIGIACLNKKRSAILIEQDPENYGKAKTNIQSKIA